jgi:hypothetical protein
MPASGPRLSSLRPSKLLFLRASLADRQPAWESGLAQRILAEKMGGEGVRCAAKNSAFTLHYVCILECRLLGGRVYGIMQSF